MKDQVEVAIMPDLPVEVRSCSDCRHAPEHALVIGGRIDRKAPRQYALDGALCLACGRLTNTARRWSSWPQGWMAAQREHGWHHQIGHRLQTLAEHNYGSIEEMLAAA